MRANERRPAGDGAADERSAPGGRDGLKHTVSTELAVAPDDIAVAMQVANADLSAPELELGVIGACLACPDRVTEFLGPLEAGDFADPRRRELVKLLRDMAVRGVPPEIPLVVDALQADGRLPNIAGENLGIRLHDALRAAAVPASLPHYRRSLIRMRWRREALALGVKLIQLAHHGSDSDVQAALDAAVKEIGRSHNRLAGQASSDNERRRTA